MTLQDYLKIFRHRLPIILSVTLIAAALTWILTPANSAANAPRSYTATSTLLVGYRPTETGQSGVALGRIALLIKTGTIPEEVARRLGRDDPVALANQVIVESDSEAMAVTIANSDSDPAAAEAVANGFAEASVAYFETNPATNTTLSILQAATAIPDAGAGTIIPPGRLPRTLLAGLVGLLLGLALSLLVDRIDSRMRSRDEVHAALGLPIVAEVPKLPRGKRTTAPRIVMDRPMSGYADGYRAARATVTHSLQSRAGAAADPDTGRTLGSVVLVTSANPAEGKTTSVGNLAASFVEAGARVLVLDADLRSPDAHNVFDVPQSAGISDYFGDVGIENLEALIRPTNTPGVGIITAGTQLARPTSLASRIGPLLDEARLLADIVLVDTAPLLVASDVFDVLPLVDTVLVVVRSGKVSEHDGTRMAELLGRFRVPVAGVLWIGGRKLRGRNYGYGYGYGESGTRAKSKARKAPSRAALAERSEPVAAAASSRAEPRPAEAQALTAPARAESPVDEPANGTTAPRGALTGAADGPGDAGTDSSSATDPGDSFDPIRPGYQAQADPESTRQGA